MFEVRVGRYRGVPTSWVPSLTATFVTPLSVMTISARRGGFEPPTFP